LTAGRVRDILISSFGYTDKQLPTERTIRTKMNDLGYTVRKPAKCKPQDKIEETDDIFEMVHAINDEADNDPEMVRISIDTKAVVKVGDFARGGRSRQNEKALDHDFNPDEKVTPFAAFLPKTKQSFIWHATSKVTADFMADRIDELIPVLKQNNPEFQTLVINADNGPESSGRRTQWLKRIVEISDKHQIGIQLAYYPPYHSKYNPVERLWGVLENHWNGELLSSVHKVVGMTRTMTYAGIKPVVRLIRDVYYKGVKLNKKEMEPIEERLERTEDLEDWFIWIEPKIG
ncbi:MAG: transposase, partial [Bacteroidota bacterium]